MTMTAVAGGDLDRCALVAECDCGLRADMGSAAREVPSVHRAGHVDDGDRG